MAATKENDYRISLTWDDEACVRIATSKDIRGLVLEHESFDTLIQEIRLAVPELLGSESRAKESVRLSYAARRQERLLCNG